MQAHVRFENDKAFCLANVFRCVFIPTVWIKNPGFLLVNQRRPTVIDLAGCVVFVLNMLVPLRML